MLESAELRAVSPHVSREDARSTEIKERGKGQFIMSPLSSSTEGPSRTFLVTLLNRSCPAESQHCTFNVFELGAFDSGGAGVVEGRRMRVEANSTPECEGGSESEGEEAGRGGGRTDGMRGWIPDCRRKEERGSGKKVNLQLERGR
jgi:hypothetical protein